MHETQDRGVYSHPPSATRRQVMHNPDYDRWLYSHTPSQAEGERDEPAELIHRHGERPSRLRNLWVR
jgi:hypothetical protein